VATAGMIGAKFRPESWGHYQGTLEVWQLNLGLGWHRGGVAWP